MVKKYIGMHKPEDLKALKDFDQYLSLKPLIPFWNRTVKHIYVGPVVHTIMAAKLNPVKE